MFAIHGHTRAKRLMHCFTASRPLVCFLQTNTSKCGSFLWCTLYFAHIACAS